MNEYFQRLEKAKSQKYKKLSKVESLNYSRSEHEIKKTSLITWSVSLEMLNKSIASFRLLYLKNCQNWAQATLYKVYACFWVYMLFIKTRDNGGFMCRVTGIYYLGYPRGSGNFFMRLTLWWHRRSHKANWNSHTWPCGLFCWNLIFLICQCFPNDNNW